MKSRKDEYERWTNKTKQDSEHKRKDTKFIRLDCVITQILENTPRKSVNDVIHFVLDQLSFTCSYYCCCCHYFGVKVCARTWFFLKGIDRWWFHLKSVQLWYRVMNDKHTRENQNQVTIKQFQLTHLG